MTKGTKSTIVPLGDLSDVQVADGSLDVRGWKVRTAESQEVGDVHELLVDAAAGRVRYLDVALDKKVAGERGQHILVPIGVVQLDDTDDQVIVSGLTASELGTVPPYDKKALTREYETSVLQVFGAGASGSAGGDFYASQHFDDSRFLGGRATPGSGVGTHADQQKVTISEEELEIGKRQASAGEVGVRVTVDTERVQERVPVSHEEVTIERRPITAAAPGTEADIQEEEIRVPLSQEELVVDKRVVGKEEVVISKRTVTEDQIVEGEIRKERVEIDGPAGRPRRPQGSVPGRYTGSERRRRSNTAYAGPERRAIA